MLNFIKKTNLVNVLIILFLILFPLAEIGKVQLGIISVTLNDLTLSILIIVWIMFKRKKLYKIKNTALFKPIVIFSSIGGISLLLNFFNLKSDEFLISLLYLLRWIGYVFLYFILVSANKIFIKKISYILLVPISLFIFFGYLQFFFYPSLRNLYYLGWDEHLYRLFSSFLDPNFAGTFLVITLIFVISLLLDSLKSQNKNFTITLSTIFILNLIAVYLTYSRSALIMLFVCVITFLILKKKKKILLILLIPLIAFIFISPKSFQTEGTNLLRITSSEARISAARDAIKIFKINPILGVGFNAYRYAQNKYNNLTDRNWQITHSGAGTDNSFLFILATTGILGFIAYLYLLYKMFFLGKENLRKNKFAAVLISSLLGVMVSSIFVNSLFFVYIMGWIWIMAALTENS